METLHTVRQKKDLKYMSLADIFGWPGGKWVINPSGGLISKGHPLGATGLAQCAELCWQLRQMCGKRQVPNCRAALQHNLGLGTYKEVLLTVLYREIQT